MRPEPQAGAINGKRHREGDLVPFKATSLPADAPTAPRKDQPWRGIPFAYAVKRFFFKYAIFSGRASRSEFWWAFLFNALAPYACAVLVEWFMRYTALGYGLNGQISPFAAMTAVILTVTLISFYRLATLVPTLALYSRRLHDANLGAAWLAAYCLIQLALFFGLIIVFANSASSVPHWQAMIDSFMDRTLSSEARIFLLNLMEGFLVIYGLRLLLRIAFLVLLSLPARKEGKRFDQLTVLVPAEGPLPDSDADPKENLAATMTYAPAPATAVGVN